MDEKTGGCNSQKRINHAMTADTVETLKLAGLVFLLALGWLLWSSGRGVGRRNLAGLVLAIASGAAIAVEVMRF